MSKLKYIKYWNSQKVLESLFEKLSLSEKAKLQKLCDLVYKTIDKCEHQDIIYSMFLHILSGKVELLQSFPDEPILKVIHKNDEFKEETFGIKEENNEQQQLVSTTNGSSANGK